MGNWTWNLCVSKQPFNNQCQIYFWDMGLKTYLLVIHSSRTTMEEAVPN